MPEKEFLFTRDGGKDEAYSMEHCRKWTLSQVYFRHFDKTLRTSM